MKLSIVPAAAIMVAMSAANTATLLAAEAQLVVGTGHTASVRTLAYSPDGRFALSGSFFGGAAKLWEIESGRELRTLTPISGVLFSVAFSPDSRFALTAGRAVELWDLATGEKARVFSKVYPPGQMGASFSSASFSADGNYVIAGETFEEVRIWRAATGEEIHVLKSAPGKKLRDLYHIRSTALSSDGRLAASGGNDAEVKLWNAISGELLHRLTGHKDDVWSLAFSPDDRFLLSGGKKKIKLWEVGSGKLLRTFSGSQDFVTSLVFSPDGRRALSTNRDGEMVYWDVASGKKLDTFEGKQKGVETWGAATFSPDGKYALHGRRKTMKLWNLDAREVIREFRGYSGSISELLFPPGEDDLVLTVQWDGRLKYWDLGTGREIRSFRVEDYVVGSVAYSSDAKRLFYLSSDDKAVVADARTGETIRTFPNDDSAWAPAFSLDGAMVLTTDGNEAVLWDANSGGKLSRMKDSQYLRIAAFSPDNRFALIGGEGNVKVWDTATGRHVRDLEIDRPGSGRSFRAITVSSDGRLVLAGALFDPRVFLWDLASGELLHELTGHRNGIVAVALSPDGSRALTSGFDKSTVILWDISSGERLDSFPANADSVAFSPDGRFGLAGGRDGVVWIYDIGKQRLLGSRSHIDEKDWVVSAEDGRFDGSADGIRRLHFVRGLETHPLEAFYEKFYTPNLLLQLQTEKPGETAVPVDLSLEIGMPPVVDIVYPQEGEQLSSQSLTLETRVTDRGGGIDEVRLYQNEKLVSDAVRAIAVREKTDAGDSYRFEVVLSPGRNDFKVIALSTNRTESKPARVSVDFTGGATAATADLYLLSIGINEYKNSAYNLNYGHSDAQSFSAALAANGKDIFPTIVTREIYNEQAVKGQIEREIEELIAATGPEDVFVFYYAGHGVMSDADEGQDADFFLVLHDVIQLYGRDELLRERAVSAAQLRDWLKRIPAQKQLIILDACQAGGAVETFARRGAAEQKAIAQLARSTGTAIIASAGTEQFASEFEALGHGLFTYALLQALSGNADGGDPRDGKITVKEIEAYLADRVPELSKQYRGSTQYPNSYAVGNDFPLGLTGRPTQ